MIKDDNIEAVFIATDAPSHARLSIAAMERGKHVACCVPAVFGSLEDADRLFEAVRHLAAREFRVGLPRDDDVSALGQRSANRIVGLAAHDDRVARRGPLEVLEILWEVPRQPAVPADYTVAGNRHDQRERRQSGRRVGHTATGALIRGWGR